MGKTSGTHARTHTTHTQSNLRVFVRVVFSILFCKFQIFHINEFIISPQKKRKQ